MGKNVSLDRIGEGNKEIAFDILGSKKIGAVTVEFEGSGDSGQLEPSDLPDKIKKFVVKGSRVSQGTVWGPGGSTERWKDNCTLEEVIQSVCYDVLEDVQPGWEISEGSFGRFTFNVEERSVTLEFNQRIVETEYHEYRI